MKHFLKITGLAILITLIFPQNMLAAKIYSHHIEDILEEINEEIATAKTSLGNKKDYDTDFKKIYKNAGKCKSAGRGVSVFVKDFLDFYNFFSSFEDLFRNYCHLNDIWVLEDKLKEVNNLMYNSAFRCKNTNEFETIYKKLSNHIKLLRKYGTAIGETPIENSSRGINDKISLGLENYRYYSEEYANCKDAPLSTSIKRLKKSFSDLKKNITEIKNLKKNIAELWKTKEKRQAEAKRKAKEWWEKVLRVDIDLQFVKFDLMLTSKNEDNEALSLKESMTKIKDYIENRRNKQIEKRKKEKTVKEILEEKGIITPENFFKKLEEKKENEKEQETFEEFEAQIKILFKDIGEEQAKDLENKALIFDECIQKAYTQDDTLRCMEPPIIPEKKDRFYLGPHSLPSLEKSLDNILKAQCRNRPACVIFKGGKSAPKYMYSK